MVPHFKMMCNIEGAISIAVQERRQNVWIMQVSATAYTIHKQLICIGVHEKVSNAISLFLISLTRGQGIFFKKCSYQHDKTTQQWHIREGISINLSCYVKLNMI